MSVIDVQEIADTWAKSVKQSYQADITGLRWRSAQCTLHDTNANSKDVATEQVFLERFPYDYPEGSVEATSTFQQTVTRTTAARVTVSRGIKLGAVTEVNVGFSALIGGKLQLNGELDLSKCKETTVESKEEWACIKTYPVYPQTVAVLEVLVHVKPFQKNFTSIGEIRGRVKAVKSGKTKREVEVADLFEKLNLLGTNEFEKLTENGKVVGVKVKVTGSIDGNVGISSEVKLRQEKMTVKAGNTDQPVHGNSTSMSALRHDDIVQAVKDNDGKKLSKILLKGVDTDWINKDGESALHIATQLNYREMALMLLQNKADANLKDKNGSTSLHIAVRKNYREMAHTLLQYGADVNAVDGDGKTALEIAVIKNYKEAALVLLNRGADTNAMTKEGYPLLSEAVRLNFRETAFDLIQHGANVNAKGVSCCTALHIAVERNFVDIVGDLLRHGADIWAQNKDGMTPTELARERSHREISKLLENVKNNLL